MLAGPELRNDIHNILYAGPCMRILILSLTAVLLSSVASAQDVAPGGRLFEGVCGRCHGGDGNGAEMGPAIVQRLKAKDDRQLATLIREGIPSRGMPPSPFAEPELTALI